MQTMISDTPHLSGLFKMPKFDKLLEPFKKSVGQAVQELTKTGVEVRTAAQAVTSASKEIKVAGKEAKLLFIKVRGQVVPKTVKALDRAKTAGMIVAAVFVATTIHSAVEKK